MWGGIKHFKDHSNFFREWSANKPLEQLRKSLFTEPRPWYLGSQIHQFNHLIDDNAGSRLMRWCASVYSLEPHPQRKADAYHYSQELFSLMIARHRPADHTFAQYLSLCEAGGDVSSAYQWIRYMVDHRSAFNASSTRSSSGEEEDVNSAPSGGAADAAYQLWHYVWLLRVVMNSPNDDVVDEMVAAVKEVYETFFCAGDELLSTGGQTTQLVEEMVDASADGMVGFGKIIVRHMVCETYNDQVLQWELFSLMTRLRPRMQDRELKAWCTMAAASMENAGPYPRTAVLEALKLNDWVFPVLDAGERIPQSPSIRNPLLVDSLLGDAFVEKIQSASFAHSVHEVGFWIQAYLEDIAAEHQKLGPTGSNKKHYYAHRPTATNPIPIWRDYVNVSHQAFRKKLVESQGVSAELYHYLIVALCQSSPRLALATKKKMVEQGMQVLDLTRAVLIAACRESVEEQKTLLVEQQKDFAYRNQLDADHDASKIVETFWKFEHHEFFHLRNGVARMRDFYCLLMEELGVTDVQRLIAAVADVPMQEEEVVVLDEDAREAVYSSLRKRRGAEAVGNALDVITEHCPLLDLALVNAIPHFGDYTLAANDEIATSVEELSMRLLGAPTDNGSQGGPVRHAVYLLDSSFIEASEQFFTVASSGKPDGHSILVIPWFCLRQISETAEGNVKHCMDADVIKWKQKERSLAIQRLQQVAMLLSQQHKQGSNSGTRIVLLHFSECMLAQSLSKSFLPSLSPETSDNDLMCCLSLMISTMMASVPSTVVQVMLCTDDPALLSTVRNEEDSGTRDAQRVFDNISVVTTPKGEQYERNGEEGGLSLGSAAVKMVSDIASAFEPKLVSTAQRKGEDRPPVEVRADVSKKSLSACADVDVTCEGVSAEPAADDLFGVMSDGHLETQLNSVEVSSPTHSSNTLQPADGAPTWLSMLDGLDGSGEVSKGPEENPVREEGGEAPHGERSPTTFVDVAEGEQEEPSGESPMYSEFGVRSPDEQMAFEMRRRAGRGHDETSKRRRTTLQREYAENRGYTKKGRLQLARQLSNAVGRRVPFNFRYKVFEANVNDPRNARLRRSYDDAASLKRSRQQ